MFEKELDVIRAAEQEAEDLVKKAGIDSKSILAEGKRAAAKTLETAEADRRKIFEGYVSDGTEIADRNYANAMAEAERKRTAIAEDAHDRLDQAVDLIVERIVSTSGDR